jgi:type I restriction enzyme S subunit
MIQSWPVVRLGEVLSHRKEFLTIDDVATYKRARVQLHAQGIVLRDEVPGALVKTKKQQVCRTGEFLVARSMQRWVALVLCLMPLTTLS